MISGASLIGGEDVAGDAGARAVAAASGQMLDPPITEASLQMVRQACAGAARAFDAFRDLPAPVRADFIEAIASNIADLGDGLIERAMAESGLPEARLRGERERTIGQLRLFAALLREGVWAGAVIEPPQPDRQPAPKPDLRQRRVPLGPVAVFGASNFPLAFSVAGGDTASALAAGCPVVVKGHPAHPGVSEMVGRAIVMAVERCGLPPGVFSLLQGRSHALGAALVADPDIKAVGFTGSRGGGLALMEIAARRREPIPVFAEMSSVNPVLIFPAALEQLTTELARGFVASLNLGAGQFCTNPGIIALPDTAAADRFETEVAGALAQISGAPMLTAEILARYAAQVEARNSHEDLRLVGEGAADAPACAAPTVFATSVDRFLGDHRLQEEVFGASSILVRCRTTADFSTLVEALEGQLTITVQVVEADVSAAAALRPLLERKCGRILANGWPTGVEVARAMVHGGPFPATSDGRSTSVGTAAIERFLRPVCYQDLPAAMLPEVLRETV